MLFVVVVAFLSLLKSQAETVCVLILHYRSNRRDVDVFERALVNKAAAAKKDPEVRLAPEI